MFRRRGRTHEPVLALARRGPGRPGERIRSCPPGRASPDPPPLPRGSLTPPNWPEESSLQRNARLGDGRPRWGGASGSKGGRRPQAAAKEWTVRRHHPTAQRHPSGALSLNGFTCEVALNRHGAEPGQVHRLPPAASAPKRLTSRRAWSTPGQQRRDQAHQLPEGMGEPDKWNGGWVRKTAGASNRARAASGLAMKISPTPTCRRSTTTTSPSPATTTTAKRAGDEGQPDARPRADPRAADGRCGRAGRDLGGEFSKRSADETGRLRGAQKAMVASSKTFMMLPRVRTLPEPGLRRIVSSGSIYKRGRRHRADRPGQVRRRMCVSGCPYKKIYYNWKSGKAEKCIFCYPRIRPASRRVQRDLRGRIRYLGVLLYDADRIRRPPASSVTATCTGRSATSSWTRTTRR